MSRRSKILLSSSDFKGQSGLEDERYCSAVMMVRSCVSRSIHAAEGDQLICVAHEQRSICIEDVLRREEMYYNHR